MESINVKDIQPDKRQWLESSIGRHLEDNQKIIIRVITPGVEPDQKTRDEAIDSLMALAHKGTRHRESLAVSAEEADVAVDEATDVLRSRKAE